jgi:hypothetical protein
MEACHSPLSTIHEKKTPKIQPKFLVSKKFSKTEEYDLKKNFFDPNKSSPPNEFLIKLFKRFKEYEDNSVIDDFMIEVGGDEDIQSVKDHLNIELRKKRLF